MLKLQHLTKRFGAAPLFTDLCMEVDAPVVLWAPSGWGKTTLLRILMGLEVPDSGTVQGVGRVGAVFQEDRLCPQLTAVQNVELVLPEGKTQYKTQIVSDFQRFGYDEQALALPARKLSGGQKRRAALLRALWAGCDTLLLDEPFTGLDAPACQSLGRLLDSLAAEGRLVIASHHDLNTAADIFDAILLMNRELVAFGPPGEVLAPSRIRETYGMEPQPETQVS